MSKTAIRSLSAMFALLLAAGTVVSCGDAGKPVETEASTETVTEAVTEDPLNPYAELPEENYDGYTFTFYARGAVPNSFVVEEEIGDTIKDAIYQRNLAVSERFNVEFESQYQEGDANAVNAKTVLMANEDVYDIVYPHARYAFSTYAMEGLCYNWLDLKYVNLDKPYWYQDAKESFTIMGYLPFMVGDINHDTLSSTKCLYFNKAIAANYDTPNLYEAVKAGTWTLDMFDQIIKGVQSDVNGDGNLEINVDLIAYGTSWWGGPTTVLYCGNQRVAEINEEGEMYLTLNTERTIQTYDKYFHLFDNASTYIHMNDNSSIIGEAFKNGLLFIEDASLGSANGLRDMELDFGILPWPKLDEAEKDYHTIVDASVGLLIVPVCAGDVDRTSVILEALCYESSKTVIPAFYDIALQTKSSRDEESSEMLDIIRAARIYDVGYYVGVSALGSTGYNLTKTADHSFASFYAANEKAAQTSVDKINKAFADMLANS